MAAEPIQLSYGTKPKTHRRFLHIFILPLLWLPAGIGSRIYYGDEYGSFVFANLPAMPLMLLLEHSLGIPNLFLVAMTFNFVLMIALGYLMDRIRVPRWWWILFIVLLVFAATVSLPALNPRPYQSDDMFTRLFPTWAPCLYLLVIASIFIRFLSRLWSHG